MSKSSRDTLFGITLTELIIIIFFIMLLLALFNIEDLVNKIPKGKDSKVAAEEIIVMLDPDADIESGFIPIDFIREEIKKLQDQIAKTEESNQDESGTGECGEGFWISPKCADHCWSINSPDSSRQYDYLLDIGICESFALVQRSVWITKTEADFQQVSGAEEIVSKKRISKSDLSKLLGVIKEPGFQREPKQCYHSVNLIDLGSASVASWESSKDLVDIHVQPYVLTPAREASYENVKRRFPKDACVNVIQPMTTEKNIIKPKINFEDFSASLINDRRCRNISSQRFTMEFNLTISKLGEVIGIDFLDNEESLNRSKLRLLDITKDSLLATTFTPATEGRQNIEYQFKQLVTLPKSVCR